jgi:carboxylesterase
MDLNPLLQAFEGEQHQAFYFQRGEPAALLVHGFPGSPAEMLPLGQVLAEAGWTVQGITLPGLGQDIQTLQDRKNSDWVDAVRMALRDLKQRQSLVLLVGFSMGGAIAIQVAALEQPAGLILMAPFWRVPGLLWASLPILRWFVPSIKPYDLLKPDQKDPEFRKGIAKILPGVDLDDPQVLSGIKEFSIPLKLIDEIRRAGREAWAASSRLNCPVLIIQGAHDDVVPPHLTLKLKERIPSKVHYLELDAGHDLTDPSGLAWNQILAAIQDFQFDLEKLSQPTQSC